MSRNLHVDIHAHFYPEAYLKLLSEEGAHLLKGRSPLPLDPWFTDLDARRKEMDRQGVQVHVLSLTPGGPELHESAGYYPMAYWVDGELGLRLAQAMNDAMAEAHTAFPDRFLGLATIPMQSPALALQELRRAATLPGIRGVYMPTNVGGKDLSHPDFLPIFESIEALRLPIFLHPALTVVGAERLAHHFYLGNLLGNPFEAAIAAAHLIFGGVLDRFKRIQICLPHAGGALPYLVGRLDRGWEVTVQGRIAATSTSTATSTWPTT